MKFLYKSGSLLLYVALAAWTAGAAEPSPEISADNIENPEVSSPGRLELSCNNGVKPITANFTLKNSKNQFISIPGIYGGAIPEEGSVFGVPPGLYELILSAGPRYLPWNTTFEISSDEKLAFAVVLQPFHPLWEHGWRAIDPYVAPQQGDNPNLRFETVMLQALSQGVRGIGIDHAQYPALAGFLETNNSKIFNKQAFLTASREERGGYCLWPRPELPGSNYKLELQKKAWPFLYQQMAAWKAQNAFTVWQHSAGGAELVFATVAGPLYDAIDVSDHDFSLKLWRFLLDQGYRVLAVAGGPEVAGQNGENGHNPVDRFAQVSGYLPAVEACDSYSFLKQIRAGNLTASNGPFVSFKIDTISPGATLTTSRATRLLTIEAFASSDRDDSISSIELLHNGTVLREYKGVKHQSSQEINDEVIFSKPGWTAVYYRSLDKNYFAITNPIWFADPDSSPPEPVTTTVKFRVVGEEDFSSGFVEIWNAGAFLGRYQVGSKGLNLDLPPTANLTVLDSKGIEIAQYTLYQKSGAAEYVASLGEDPKALLDEKTYARMRQILDEVLIPINLNPEIEPE
ncbi:MAG: hypothetical protein JXA52_00730 [Planctomycetes bacterium]|nr:hypothetical protein [Planctomycetota bacterium]